MEDIWDKPVLRQILAAGAIWYMIGATSWSMPAGFPLKSTIDRLYNPTFRRLGLWQGWDMFAPNPRDEDIYVTAVLEFVDGSTQIENLSNMAQMSYTERYAKERWRKFMNDNMRIDSNKAMWNDSAAWLARRAARRERKDVRKVELYRHWRKCLLPDEPGNVLDDKRPYNKFLFYTFSIGGAPVRPATIPAGKTSTAPSATPVMRPLVPLKETEKKK